MCKKSNLGTDDSKSKLVETLCRKLQLNEPDELEEFDGDLSKIPTQLQEISKLPVFKLKQYLIHYNIPWSGSKDQLALTVQERRTSYFREKVTGYWRLLMWPSMWYPLKKSSKFSEMSL